MTGCTNLNRSLVFSTATTQGLELKIADNTGQPGSIVLGYKRAEVLFDPIIQSTETNKYTIMTNSHSVIAKFQGEAGAGDRSTMRSSQWFAAGKAAELLAANGGAIALTDNEKVAESIAKAKIAEPFLQDGKPPLYLFYVISELKRQVEKNAYEAGVEIPQKLRKLMENLDAADVVRLNITFPQQQKTAYRFKNGALQKTSRSFSSNYRDLYEYYKMLCASVPVLEQVLDKQQQPNPTDNVERKALELELEYYTLYKKNIEELFVKDKAVIELMNALTGQ
jgi:hypothetical protein